MGLSASETRFSYELTNNLAKYVSSATSDIIAMIKKDPISIHSALPADLITSVTKAYVTSLDIVYVLGVSAGVCALVIAFSLTILLYVNLQQQKTNGDKEKQAGDNFNDLEKPPLENDFSKDSADLLDHPQSSNSTVFSVQEAVLSSGQIISPLSDKISPNSIHEDYATEYQQRLFPTISTPHEQ